MNMSPADLSRHQLNSSGDVSGQPNTHFLQPIAHGLVRTVLVSSLGVDYPLDQENCRRCSEYVVLKVLGMPGFLRFPMTVLTIVFDICGILFGGRLFRHLSEADQLRQFKAWQKSPLGPCRDLTMFYQKMGVFIYFSLVDSHRDDV